MPNTRWGGIVQFATDLYSPEQITAYNALLQRAAEIPLFLGIDEEGGTVARLANHSAFDLPQYKSAGAVGASGNPEDALKMGQTIGAYLGEYGFNMDFAPVADVNTNPNNPVIGNRSFSSDCNVAGQMAKAMAEGLEEKGIVPVFKHFPGHGDTAQDSHEEVAYSNKTLEELQACEFIPFSGLTENQCVMVGHIALPEVTGNMTPATLSSEIVTGHRQLFQRRSLPSGPGSRVPDHPPAGGFSLRFCWRPEGGGGRHFPGGTAKCSGAANSSVQAGDLRESFLIFPEKISKSS